MQYKKNTLHQNQGVRRVCPSNDYAKVSFITHMLEEREELFRAIFEQYPIGIIVGKNNKIYDVNPMAEIILGRSREELLTTPWQEYTYDEDIQKDEALFTRLKAGEISGYSMDKRYIRPDGSIVWTNMTIAPLKVGSQSELNYLCLIEDISKRVQAEEELRESERSKSVMLSNLPGMAYRCNFDPEWTMQYVSDGCYELTGYKPESLLYNKEVSFNSLINAPYRSYLWELWNESIRERKKVKVEYEITTASGMTKWVFEQGQAIFSEDGHLEAIEGLIIDITDRKMKEKEVQYLIMHDSLTGLYNRQYFQQEAERINTESHLPLTVMVGDINGLKLVNDAFGHSVGDKLIIKASEILKTCLRQNDILARTGGDEFSILMPCTDSEKAHVIYKTIKRLCEKYNTENTSESFNVNISLGYATKTSVLEDIDQITRTAEDYMYKRKLLELTSSHSDIVSSIKATMFERSHEAQEHADRLSELSQKIGIELNLSQSDLDDLALLATLHDIGKVGIDDRILNKPGELNEKEWFEMRKHSEIGYRIAMASPELMPIAEYILYHHERWDGKGYPRGLKGESIPLASRILSVVDAYDAMTQDRIYRKAMSQEAALEELNKNSGTQFDPAIVDIFINKILPKKRSQSDEGDASGCFR